MWISSNISNQTLLFHGLATFISECRVLSDKPEQQWMRQINNNHPHPTFRILGLYLLLFICVSMRPSVWRAVVSPGVISGQPRPDSESEQRAQGSTAHWSTSPSWRCGKYLQHCILHNGQTWATSVRQSSIKFLSIKLKSIFVDISVRLKILEEITKTRLAICGFTPTY